MGIATVTCEAGCTCEPQTIDAHKVSELRNVSVFETHTFSARRVGSSGRGQRECELALVLLSRTSSGSTKFKVRSITVTSALSVTPHIVDADGGAAAPVRQ
jgi:hypothetical protein